MSASIKMIVNIVIKHYFVYCHFYCIRCYIKNKQPLLINFCFVLPPLHALLYLILMSKGIGLQREVLSMQLHLFHPARLLCPIHVVTFTLISIWATDYIQKGRGQASHLNVICRQIWYQSKSDYKDRALVLFKWDFSFSAQWPIIPLKKI